jgi:hypothetical protein
MMCVISQRVIHDLFQVWRVPGFVDDLRKKRNLHELVWQAFENDRSRFPIREKVARASSASIIELMNHTPPKHRGEGFSLAGVETSCCVDDPDRLSWMSEYQKQCELWDCDPAFE